MFYFHQRALQDANIAGRILGILSDKLKKYAGGSDLQTLNNPINNLFLLLGISL